MTTSRDTAGLNFFGGVSCLLGFAKMHQLAIVANCVVGTIFDGKKKILPGTF